MAKKANPRRYAQAVFELAQESKELDRWQSDLDAMALAVGDASLRAVLDSQRISAAEKTRVLGKVLSGVNPLALNLALLLVSRSGIGMVPPIAAEYKKLLDAYRGITAAEVTTAIPLDAKDKENIGKQLSTLTGARVEIQTAVDPQILGGVVARVGGKLLDGSTRSKLAALKRNLVGRG